METLSDLLRQRSRLVEAYETQQRQLASKIADTSDAASRNTAGIEDTLSALFEECHGPKALSLSSSSSTALAGLRSTASQAVAKLTDQKASDTTTHNKQLRELDNKIAAARAKLANS
jgi:hypothetical protein